MPSFTTVNTASTGTLILQSHWEAVADNLNYNLVTPVAEVVVDGSASEVVFAGLSLGEENDDGDVSSAWAHLMMMIRARSTSGGDLDSIRVWTGWDYDATANDYWGTYAWSTNDTYNTGTASLRGSTIPIEIPGDTADPESFGCAYLLYAGSAYTTIAGTSYNRGFLGGGGRTKATQTADNNTGLYMGGGQSEKVWDGTIRLTLTSGSFESGSRFTLYGWGGI